MNYQLNKNKKKKQKQKQKHKTTTTNNNNNKIWTDKTSSMKNLQSFLNYTNIN